MEPDTTFQLFGRFDGPLNLRLILQPCIAAIFGYLDGTKDAKAGAPPYFWRVTNVGQPERQALIKQGWASVGKVFTLAFVYDCVFQYASTNRFPSCPHSPSRHSWQSCHTCFFAG